MLIQNPDYYGEVSEIKKLDTVLIVCSNLSALSVLEPPREADIVVGDIQPLGISMNFGGPHMPDTWLVKKHTYAPNARTFSWKNSRQRWQ